MNTDELSTEELAAIHNAAVKTVIEIIKYELSRLDKNRIKHTKHKN